MRKAKLSAEEKKHNHLLSSRTYWENNKDKVRAQQREYRREQRANLPFLHLFTNQKAAAKRGEYLDTSITDWTEVRELYRRAWEIGSKVVMIVGKADGGMFTPSNLKIKEKAE